MFRSVIQKLSFDTSGYGFNWNRNFANLAGKHCRFNYNYICSTSSLRLKASCSSCRAYSQQNAVPNPEEDAANERDGEKNTTRFRRYKKLFSTLLFSATLVGVAYARRRRQNDIEERFRNCVRIPPDEMIKGSVKEFYLYEKGPNSSGCVVTAECIRDGTLKAIKNFEVKDDDIIVASFPKTGTTWVQEIVYLLVNNLDTKKASSAVLETRFPYLEYPYPGLKTVLKQDSPRLIKTHLTMDLLPEDITRAKIIYITRNPKDTAVSYYHFAKMMKFSSYTGSFTQFLEKFKKDHLLYSPFFGHLESYRKREGENLLLITYEELTRDPKAVISRVAEFLDRPISPSDLDFLVQHTSFSEMANNPSVNYSHWDDLGIRNKNEAVFMRKGKVGDWKNYFTENMDSDFNAWIQENNKGNFKFEYEL